jgi:hypothetical protein
MANFYISYNVTVTAQVEIPDTKLLKVLKGEKDLSRYFELEFRNNEDTRKELGFEADVYGVETEFDTPDISDIEKDNGNSYEWDGEKLRKI